MRSVLRAGIVLGLVAAAGACSKDSVAPKSLANPQATTAQMAAFDTLFNAGALSSFSAMSGEITPVTPAPVAAMRAVAIAANPIGQSSLLRPFAQSMQNARVFAQLIPSFSTVSATAIFPPEVAGKTFEWNATNGAYEPGVRTGAPPAGVRFILYAIDPLTGLPQTASEVGYVDLNDESVGNTQKLHVTVAGLNGSPVYVDYTVTLESLSESSARISSAGYITNGAGSPDSLRFNGSITVAGTINSVSVTHDVTFDVNSHDVHARLWEKATLTSTGTGLSVSLRINFRFEHGGEVVTLEGSFSFDDTGAGSGTLVSKVDGGLFATCHVTADATSYNLSCEGADSDGLNADEQVALQSIGDAVSHLEAVFSGLFLPALNTFGS